MIPPHLILILVISVGFCSMSGYMLGLIAKSQREVERTRRRVETQRRLENLRVVLTPQKPTTEVDHTTPVTITDNAAPKKTVWQRLAGG